LFGLGAVGCSWVRLQSWWLIKNLGPDVQFNRRRQQTPSRDSVSYAPPPDRVSRFVTLTIFTLRFPRIQKVHEDRSFRDALSHVEYQRLVKQSMGLTENNDGDLEAHWVMKLGEQDDRGRRRGNSTISDESTQSTTRTASSTTGPQPQSLTITLATSSDKRLPLR
jgi:hypothetical protein